jgi:IS30 family transposase
MIVAKQINTGGTYMKSYNHFTLDERISLEKYLREGKSQSEIAKKLHRSRSTINREIRRNSNKDDTYNSCYATTSYIIRRKKCCSKGRFHSDEKLFNYVCEKLESFWSPECIVGRYKKENANVKLGHSTIYRAVKLELLPNIRAETHLRRRGKQKYGNRSDFNSIKPEHTIHDHSSEIKNRGRIGDFEGDTILGKRGAKDCVFTAVDRKSRYLVGKKCINRLSENIKYSIIFIFLRLCIKVLSLTLDNGFEFAKHKYFARELGIKVYFADPHSPWQRGTCENTNGLLRFFFPKGTDFSTITEERLQEVIDLLNDRPRKCLNWLTPREVFFSKCCT